MLRIMWFAMPATSSLLFSVKCLPRSALRWKRVKHLKSILSATDTQFGVLATGTDPDSWFFSENCRNNWFIEISRSVFESRVARWHPDMRRSPSTLNLQERVRVSNNIAEQRLKVLRKWRWTAIGFGIGFLSIGALLIWSLLK